MPYVLDTNYATVSEFNEFGVVPSFLSTLGWYKSPLVWIGAAVIAAAGVGYYMKKRGGADAEYGGVNDHKGVHGTPRYVTKRRKVTGSRRQSGRTIVLPPFDPSMPPMVDPFSMPDVVYSPAVIAQMKAQGRWTPEREAHQQKVNAWRRGEDVRFDGWVKCRMY